MAHAAALLLPGPLENLSVQVDAATLAEIAPLLRLPGVRLTITGDGHLALALPNGGLLVFPAADPVVRAFGDHPGQLLTHLQGRPDAVLDILTKPEDAALKLAAIRDTEPQQPDAPAEGSIGTSEGDTQPPEGQSGFKGIFTPRGLGDALTGSAPLGLHGPRWGRDDLKRGEIGEQGEFVVASVGNSIDHLVGLADEDPGNRNGEKIENSNNARILYAAEPVGTAFGHLGGLGDTEYWQSSGDQIYAADDGGPRVYAPLIQGPLAFSLLEDNAFADRLFDPRLLGRLSIADIVTGMDPDQGTVTLQPDGTFAYTPAPGYSGQASFTFSFTDPRTRLTVSGTVDLTVEAVADPVSIAGAASGDEDTAIALPMTIDLGDTDGSETIQSIVITGVPTGAVLDWNHALPGTVAGDNATGFTITGTEAEIRAIVASLTLTPPVNFSGSITLGLAVTSIEANADPLVPGYLDTETTHASYVVEVVPVADEPPSEAAGPYSTDEDVAVALPGLAGSLVDTDGSELLTFRITGVPAGASFDRGTDLGGGVWSFTPADIAAGLTFNPPPNANGTYDMVLVAVSTEQANSDAAQSTAPFQVIVAPVPDEVDVSTSPAGGPEDTAILFGDKIGITVNDTDASEVLTSILISDVPAGASLGWDTGVSGGTVMALGGGSYEIIGSEAAIRALLASLTLTPPLHDATDIALTIEVTTTDAGGPTNTETIVQSIVVTPVADTPTALGGTYATEEDTTVALSGVGGALVDADGSEVLTFRITNVPAGASFNVGTDLGGGVWSFTPAQIAGGISFTPPAHAHGTYDMTLVSTATETENADAAQNTALVRVVVDAQADAPSVATNAVSGVEDTAILFGNQVSIALNDADGSERVDRVTISGLPTGAMLSWNTGLAGSVSGSGSGPYAISGTEAQIRALLATFAYTPPLNDDTNVSLSVAVRTLDADGSNATTTISQAITVSADADAPSGSGSAAGTEDITIAVPITVALADTDGSETISYVDVTGVPAGATVGWTSSAGMVTSISGGFRVEGTTADIQARLLSLQITPPLHSDQDFTLAVTVRAIESNPTNGEVYDLTENHSFNVAVTVAADADTPTAIGGSYATEEDTAVALTGIGGALVDTDGSETLTFQITGVPTGASFSAGTNLGGGIWSFTPAQIATGISFTPPANAHGTYDMTLVSTATETENADAAQNTALIRVVVDAQADAPSVTTSPVSGVEDTAILFGNQVSIALNDTDGSERVDRVTISGLPSGAVLTWNTGLAGSVSGSGSGPYAISGTEAQIRALLATFAYTPPLNDDTNVSLSVAVRTLDADGSNATTTISQAITVSADADTPSGSGSAAGTEDITIAVPITVALADTDSSETISYVDVTGVPAGATVGWASSAGTVTSISGGFRVEGTTADIQARLLSLQITPPLHSDQNFTLSVTVQAIESNPTNGEVYDLTEDTSFNVAVTVAADADTPTVVGGSYATEEDTAVALAGIGGALVDTDGSETLTFQITGVPTGASFSAGTNLGGGVWSFTAAQIAGGLSFTPPAHAHGTYNMTLVSIATEGENADAAQNTAAITVVVDAQADGVTLAAAAASGNEDQSFLFGNKITWTKIDGDGSESVTQVDIADVPSGWAVTYTVSGAAVVTPTADGFTITGSETDIRSTLNTFSIQAPLHRDEDISLDITVTTTDADGSTDTTNTSQSIKVNAVADVPDVTGGSYSTDEDTAVALTGLSGALVDSDGSETLTFRISSVPTGASFSTGTNLGGGVWSFTAAQLAGGISFNPPAQANGTYNMTLRAVATEHTVAGESTADDVATRDATITVVVGAVLDVPAISGTSSTVNEDTQFNLGQNIGVTLADTDGSQSLSVTLTGIPDPAGNPSPTWTSASGVSVVDNGGGSYTISGANAATVLTVLNSFRITPPNDGDANFQVGVSVTTVETGGATTTVTGTHDVTVRAVADRPSVSISGTGNEDNFVAVPITVALNDTDGSETLQQVVVSGLPTETTGTGALYRLFAGTSNETTIVADEAGTTAGTDSSGNAYSVSNNGSGTLTFTGSTAGIISALAALSVQRGTHVGDDFTVTVVATAIESNPTLPGGEVQTLTATNTTATYTVNVIPITDGIVALAPSSMPAEEDAPIRLATSGFGYIQTDSDGSETVSYTFSGLPAGTTLVDADGDAIGTDLGSGSWSLTAAQFADAYLKLPQHQNGSFGFTFTATTDESEGTSSPVSDSRSVNVWVAPDPDAPDVSGSSTVVEDQTVNFGRNIAYSLVDTDGSEQIVEVQIADIPAAWTVSFTEGSMPTNVVLISGVYTISGTETEIRAAVDTFCITPPADADGNTDPDIADAQLTVRVTTQDIEDTYFANGDLATTEVAHTFTILADADTPLAAAADVDGVEDTTFSMWPGGTGVSVGLADTDGSETLSATITGVPTSWTVTADTSEGGTFTRNGDGSMSLTGTETQINAILAGIQLRAPLNWSGTIVGVELQVTATEVANGAEVSNKTAQTTVSFDITVEAVADTPPVHVVDATAGRAGYEDTPIAITFTTQLVDDDSSETLLHEVRGLPEGALFCNALGEPIGTQVDTDGDTVLDAWRFTAAEVAQLHVLPELHSNLDFTLEVRAVSIESNVSPTLPGYGDVAYSDWTDLTVEVIGVADKVTPAIIPTSEDEDVRFPLGQAVSASLVDVDIPQEAANSESLYFVIVGLPSNIVPTHATYIGIGWQVAAADIALVTVPVPANFSGDYLSIAPGLSVRAVTQENDRNQIYGERDFLPGELTVLPVADGFAGWGPGATVSEDSSISLSSIGSHTFADSDGSEAVVSYTIDLSNLIADAQIQGRLDELLGAGADLSDFIANYITGSFTNNGDGTLTVTPAQLTGFGFASAPFLDSNVDFSLPVTALVRDTAGVLTDDKTETSSFSVNFIGVADTPTAYALPSYSGLSTELIALNPGGSDFGGDSTDRDSELGRDLSETADGGGTIYYIVSGLNPALALVDGAGDPVGDNNNDGTWILWPADLADLHIVCAPGYSGEVTLALTTVVIENDGDRAQATTPAIFTVDFNLDGGSGGYDVAPLPVILTINPTVSSEDSILVLDIDVAFDPAERLDLNPIVTLLFDNIPAGFTIMGATYNPVNGKWVASEAAVEAGQVYLIPPADFSGTLPAGMTVEAIVTNNHFKSATTGDIVFDGSAEAPLPVWDPIADGPTIGFSHGTAIEDQAIALNISVGARDTDAASPESLLEPILVRVPEGYSLSAGTPTGTAGEYSLTQAQLAGLVLIPPIVPTHLHDVPIPVIVTATTNEPGSGATGSQTFYISMTADADAPLATASDTTGVEDASIALSGLSAALVDLDGSEILSVKISGIPEDSLLSAGANNGDGSWTIPVAALAGLTITPPKDYSGVMHLSLDVYALETSNGDVATTSVPFDVTVTGSADRVSLDPQTVSLSEGGSAALDLRIVLEDGTLTPEQLEITFTGIPAGAALAAWAGGTLVDLGSGSWRFTGSQAEANALAFSAGYAGGDHVIGMSVVTIDGASRSTATLSSFTIEVEPVADAPTLIVNPAAGPTESEIALNIFATFPDQDGSEVHSFQIAGVPAGASFNTGTDLGGGVWSFTPAQMVGLAISVAADTVDFNLSVTATATETGNSSTAFATGSIAVTIGGTGGVTIAGGSGNDTLVGSIGDDTLAGDMGIDILTGGSGSDMFTWLPSHLDASVDQITDFAAGPSGDALDLSAILAGYVDGVSDLSDFVSLSESSGSTTVRVDANGTSAFSDLVVLQGVTGLDIDTLRTNGNLLT